MTEGIYKLAKQNAVTSKQIEYGDIFFFFRPRIGATEEVKGVEDVQRFYMVTGPEDTKSKKSKKSIDCFS
jgi:hypothetical protein